MSEKNSGDNIDDIFRESDDSAIEYMSGESDPDPGDLAESERVEYRDARKRLAEFYKILEKNGFKSRSYIAEWTPFGQYLRITRPDNSTLVLQDHEVQAVIDGEKELGLEDKREFDAWYENSGYRLGHEEHKLRSKGPVEELSDEDFAKLQGIGIQMMPENKEKREKARLAYEYDETDPKRIDLLYEIEQWFYKGL